ncbi:MAG TPA: GSCFA domain-containing protein [Saprospiraceae bacterium]|nr:GSCFA domain-containing protein [Saprospiraceae bacterium]
MSPESSFLSIGSCFAEEMGRQLKLHLIDCALNPSGIAFNPWSLADLWQFELDEEDIVQHNDLWHSLKHHSRFSSPNRDQLLLQIEKGQDEMAHYKAKAQLIIVSFGTAYVYRYNKSKSIVTNCHKIPQKDFTKYQLSVNEIVSRWSDILDRAEKDSPDTHWVFTVSPIRHLKDGFVENTRSKSILHLAVEKLTQKPKARYFPSYELMMDDLRDYRYYKNDMLHPSSAAVAYIWEKFSNTFFPEELSVFFKDISKLLQMCQHRPRFNSGKELKLLHEKIEQYKSALSHQYPVKSQQITNLKINSKIS